MWQFDNVIFNVNGCGIEKLRKVFDLIYGDQTLYGYKVDNKKGIILYAYESGKNIIRFPTELQSSQVADIVFEWLKSKEAKEVPCEGWDANADHDGSNELGWRVYTEDWGHVNGDWNCLAVKPAYLWYGK